MVSFGSILIAAFFGALSSLLGGPAAWGRGALLFAALAAGFPLVKRLKLWQAAWAGAGTGAAAGLLMLLCPDWGGRYSFSAGAGASAMVVAGAAAYGAGFYAACGWIRRRKFTNLQQFTLFWLAAAAAYLVKMLAEWGFSGIWLDGAFGAVANSLPVALLWRFWFLIATEADELPERRPPEHPWILNTVSILLVLGTVPSFFGLMNYSLHEPAWRFQAGHSDPEVLRGVTGTLCVETANRQIRRFRIKDGEVRELEALPPPFAALSPDGSREARWEKDRLLVTPAGRPDEISEEWGWEGKAGYKDIQWSADGRELCWPGADDTLFRFALEGMEEPEPFGSGRTLCRYPGGWLTLRKQTVCALASGQERELFRLRRYYPASLAATADGKVVFHTDGIGSEISPNGGAVIARRLSDCKEYVVALLGYAFGKYPLDWREEIKYNREDSR